MRRRPTGRRVVSKRIRSKEIRVRGWLPDPRKNIVRHTNCFIASLLLGRSCYSKQLTPSLNTSTFGVRTAIRSRAALCGSTSPFHGVASTVFSFRRPSLVPKSAHSPGAASTPRFPSSSLKIAIFEPFGFLVVLRFEGASCVAPLKDPLADATPPRTDLAAARDAMASASSSGTIPFGGIISRCRKA